MGIRFRKSFSIGPFRINLSKSGIGFSVGTKGLRFTKKATGGSQVSASLPGTGLSYVKTLPKNKEKGKNKIWYVVAAVIIVLSIGIFLFSKFGDKLFADTAKAEATVTETAGAVQSESGTYILNTSSKKFHLESCSSANSISEDKKDTFTGDRAELIDQGYKPCGNCDP